ncbi:putative membrane protein [Anaerotaenia torta]
MGFKLRNKGIRLCGLILTIIMVARFIVVDLNQENSITRVLALIAGGGLCFLISFIYNKLSENYS